MNRPAARVLLSLLLWGVSEAVLAKQRNDGRIESSGPPEWGIQQDLELPPAVPEERLDLPKNPEEWLDWLVDKRNNWSRQVNQLGRYIDGFLGGEEAEKRSNGSFMKLGLFGRWSEGAEFETDPEFKFRLDLPRTQDRYRLVIESDSPEDKSPEERERDARFDPDNENTQTASGFLRILSQLEDWDFKADFGVRFRFPLSAFVRTEAEWEKVLDENWTFRTETKPYYYVDRGFGFNQTLFFDRRIGSEAFLRFKTEAQWEEEDGFWEFAEIVSYNRILTPRDVIVHSIGWLAESEPSPKTTGYFTRFTWRHRLYREWLFVELSPELFFSRDTGFQDEASLLAGIEIIFAE